MSIILGVGSLSDTGSSLITPSVIVVETLILSKVLSAATKYLPSRIVCTGEACTKEPIFSKWSINGVSLAIAVITHRLVLQALRDLL